MTNFVYEKEGQSRKKSMSYESVLPVQQIFGWDQVGNFSKGQYIMMHSLIYRTDLLRASQFQLPEHTFYVDNLFVFTPPSAGQDHVLSACRFYRYLIGREDQSVNEQVMIKRIDQQLKVNRLLVDQLDLSKVSHSKMREYLLNHN